MVLEDVETQSPESFTDEPYPSDNDPYATSLSQRPPQFLRIDMNQLPRPIPILGPIIGFSQSKSERIVSSYLRTAMEMAGRQLTQDEAMAMAYHIARKESYTSYGAALGLSAGVWKWYQGRDVYRFPWYTPKGDWFDPNKLGPFTGQNARNIWHGTRFIPFALVGLAAGQILAWNWSTAVAAVGVQKDPKLKDFNEALKARLQDRRVHREQSSRSMERPAPSPQPQSPSWGRGASEQEDDMSPTAGNVSWGTLQSSNQDTSPTSVAKLSAEERQQKYAEVEARIKQTPEQGGRITSRDYSFSERPSASDDASPTGGLFEAETRQVQTDSGSAWDRIRRGATSGTPSTHTSPYNSVQQEQKEGSTLGDSFSFSSTDEERELAKAEAQREFDERVERERRGGDFNEGRKW